MRWSLLPIAEQRELERRLTHKQLLVYTLRGADNRSGRDKDGWRWEDISLTLGIQIRTVRSHYQAAEIKHQQIRDRIRQEAA